MKPPHVWEDMKPGFLQTIISKLKHPISFYSDNNRDPPGVLVNSRGRKDSTIHCSIIIKICVCVNRSWEEAARTRSCSARRLSEWPTTAALCLTCSKTRFSTCWLVSGLLKLLLMLCYQNPHVKRNLNSKAFCIRTNNNENYWNIDIKNKNMTYSQNHQKWKILQKLKYNLVYEMAYSRGLI